MLPLWNARFQQNEETAAPALVTKGKRTYATRPPRVPGRRNMQGHKVIVRMLCFCAPLARPVQLDARIRICSAETSDRLHADFRAAAVVEQRRDVL